MAKRYLDGSLRSARRIFGVHVGGHTNWMARCVQQNVKKGKGSAGSRAGAQANLAAAARGCSGRKP